MEPQPPKDKERKPANEPFRLAIRRIFHGLAAHEAMEEVDARLMIREELEAEGLLPAKSKSRDGGPGPIDHWRKGFVPGDPRVVEYLAEVGFRRAQLGEAWLKTFLETAEFATSQVRDVQARLSPGVAVLNNLAQYDPTRFIGRAAELEQLRHFVLPDNPASIIQIDGVGGVGKSALALQLAHDFLGNFARMARPERFEAIVWITAKEDALDALGVRRRADPALSLNDVYLSIADALERPDIRTADAATRPRLVRQALARQRTLFIMDNLDVNWGAELVSFIHDVPRPTKIVVTTRHRIDEPYRVHLEAWGREEALRFLHTEAALKSVALSDEDAARLYDAIGGIPLALKWCLGQMAFCLTVDAILVHLSQGAADVNAYIFEKSVELLRDNPTAYRLLLALAVAAGDISREAWGSMAGLTGDILRRDQAIGELEKLSLVNHDAARVRFWLSPLARSYLRPRLAGAPELPLDLEEKGIETAAPFIPDAYQCQALATWGSAPDTIREQRFHALLGLTGEVGEVANLVKKQLYKPGAVADGAAVIDELADVAYYLAVLASLYGVTFDGLFAHLAGKLAGGHGWLNPSNSTGLEVDGE